MSDWNERTGEIKSELVAMNAADTLGLLHGEAGDSKVFITELVMKDYADGKGAKLESSRIPPKKPLRFQGHKTMAF